MFIDESGDPGLKLNAGSSDYFIVTLVAFEDNEEALAADQRIEALKGELGFRRELEFKFDKRKLTGPGFRFKESFYKYTCGLVFENAKPHLDRATVVIDGSGSREFRRQLGSYPRKRVNEPSGSRFYRLRSE